MQTERLDLSDVKRNPEKPEALSPCHFCVSDTSEKETSLLCLAKPQHEEAAHLPEGDDDVFILLES